MVLLEYASPRNLLSQARGSHDVAEIRKQVEELAHRYGWETRLYHSEFLNEGQFSDSPISLIDACVCCLQQHLQDLYIFWNDLDASLAMTVADLEQSVKDEVAALLLNCQRESLFGEHAQ